jgi:hypothetical protein
MSQLQRYSSIRVSLLLTAIFLTSCLWGAAVLAQETSNNPPGYRSINFHLPHDIERMLVVDADNDGLADLLTIAEDRISLYFQRTANEGGGFDFTSPDTSVHLQERSIGWELSDNYADAQGQRRFSLLALVNGSQVLQWQIQDREFGEPTPLLDGLNAYSGTGVNRLHFSRDINADGLEDLIIPGAGTLQLHIRNPDGSYQQPLTVLADMQINTNLFIRQALERDVGQSLRIPLIELRDVNGDGRPDLISETDERFDVFLASNSADYFPQLPSYSIDRLEIRERLGNFDLDQLDFSNLTGMLALTHEELLRDVNGDGIDDFVLREGGKVSLFMGTPDGMDFSQPQQVLRSGGNVLTVFLHDENGDGLQDLWLWRVQSISVGDLFLWLAISGSIDVEAFIYPNDGQAFARRPSRQITVSLRFPSAVRMISSVIDIREQARTVRETRTIPTELATLSGIGNTQDLLVLLDEQIQIFQSAIAAPAPVPEDRFLASLDYSRERNNYEIDIRRIIDEFEIEQNSELRAVAGRAPDYQIELNQAMRNGDIMAVDLNADQRDDIFVFLERGKEAISGMLLLSTP